MIHVNHNATFEIKDTDKRSTLFCIGSFSLPIEHIYIVKENQLIGAIVLLTLGNSSDEDHRETFFRIFI